MAQTMKEGRYSLCLVGDCEKMGEEDSINKQISQLER